MCWVLGLVNTVIEPFMDYGVSWDNEYFSIHMVEPDYQPMVGFPLSHTPGTKGKITSSTIIAEIKTKKDLDKFRGKLSGKVVLSIPPAEIDLEQLAQATPRRNFEDISVKIELEVRNRMGDHTEKANNVLGEIPGTDLKDEIVMIGAHFDTWHASPNARDDTAGCAGAFLGIYLQGNEFARRFFAAWMEPLQHLCLMIFLIYTAQKLRTSALD